MARNIGCEIIDPRNPAGPKVQAIFPEDLSVRYLKYSPVRFWNLIAAKFVLEHTQRIFYGVREFNEGGWCYTGRPERWYIRERIVVPFPRERVFAVYLNPLMKVYETRGERADAEDPLCPADWRQRYGELIWKSTS